MSLDSLEEIASYIVSDGKGDFFLKNDASSVPVFWELIMTFIT